MAKAKSADKTAPAAEGKKKREKKEGPKIVELALSTEGASGFTRTVQHVRGMGVLVTTVSENGSVSTNWIPGLKPKSKKGERFLVIDKGPKPKKEKKAKA